MFEYQKNHQYFAQVAGGMESLAAEELTELGAYDITESYRGLHFSADFADMCRINYMSRLLSRVLAPLVRARCTNEDTLYKIADEFPWESILSLEESFAISANVSHSKIQHSRFAALKVKDAIVDRFRRIRGDRPSVDRQSPDVLINLYLENDRLVISLDASGGALHKRGYRRDGLKAPMQETLAAAIIKLCGWDGSRPLHDPMCGAGTLLAESVSVACNIPPGYMRQNFGFERLPEYEENVWDQMRMAEIENMKALPEGLVSGSDIDRHAIAASRKNLRRLPMVSPIKLKVMPFQKLPGFSDSVIICNPPYAHRMGKHEETEKLYRDLGDFLKQKCVGSEAYVYFGDRSFISAIGLRPAFKRPLANGPLDGRLCRFEIYS